MTTATPDLTFFRSQTNQETTAARIDTYQEQGIDPYGKDDTVFGATMVYCCSHHRAHTTGWCTVSNYNKIPLDTPATVSSSLAADECRIKGYPLHEDGN